MEDHTRTVRVLHVDDRAEFVEAAAESIEREDGRFDVETATSAEEGLARLAETAFDCVVSDYDMPGRNGIEFLRAVRAEDPDLPFVLFTGKGSEEVAGEAITAGATDYVRKGADRYELLANRIRNAVEQYRATRRADRVDRINTLSADINQALLRATTREEVETRVCEIMSGSSPYRFAWIGAFDPETGRIEPRASAGVEEGYLDEIEVTVDERPTGRGPGGTAIRERRVAVSQDVREDPEFGPWREAAIERGYWSVAAVPLEYEETLYGELLLYADRTGAFDEAERELLRSLGADVGHAIYSIEVRERLRRERDRRRSLFENAPTPVVEGEVRGADHVVTDVNDAFESAFGLTAEAVVGRDVAEVVVPEGERERHREIRERTAAGEASVAEVERVTAEGARKFLLNVVPFAAGEGWFAWYTDVTDREERERTLERLVRRSRELIDANTRAETGRVAVDIARTVLGAPLAGIHLLTEDGSRLEAIAAMDEVREEFGVPPTYDRAGEDAASRVVWETFERGEPRYIEDTREVGRLAEESPARSGVIHPLGGHGVLVVSTTETGGFDQTRRVYAELLAQTLTAALDRVERETVLQRHKRQLERLHRASEDLLQATTRGEIAERIVDAAADILGFPITLVRYYSEEAGGLVPVAATDSTEAVLGSRGVFGPEGGSLNWEAYESGSTAVYGDVGDVDRAADSDTPLASLMLFPLGEHGTISVGDTVPEAFDESDRYHGELLARTATLALTQLDRERELVRQRDALERQNEQLDEFARVVSHDLRNPLNVARGYLDLAAEDPDGGHLRTVDRALRRMEELVEDVLLLARAGDRLGETEPVDLADLAERCWRHVERGSARLVVESDATVRADRSRLEQLLENLFRNAVEHGGDGVTVTVGDLPDGFYVEDTGPGVPEADRGSVFEAGYTTSAEGTGFGLSIVKEIVQAHGWSIAATAGTAGGARFEVTDVDPGR